MLKLQTKLLIVIMAFGLFAFKSPEAVRDLPSKYVKYGNVKIHYKEYGKGKYNLVFVHGWGCDVNTWDKQLAYFGNKARVVFIDLPGFGKSDKPHCEYTLDFFAESVKAVLDNLSIDNPVLIGHSLGTPVCRQVILKYPQINSLLCDIDGVYCDFPADSIKREQYLKEIKAFADMFSSPDYNKNVNDFILALFYKTTPEAVKQYALSVMSKTPQYVGASTMKNLINETYWDKTRINIPILVVCSKNSGIPNDYENTMKALYSNLEYYEFENVGHFIMQEDAEKFNNMLWNFIKSVNNSK